MSVPEAPKRMKFYTLAIVIERKSGETGYVAYSPTLPGCFCRGETFEEARRNLHSAVEAQVESLAARGQPINGNERLVHVGELTVAVPE
jgi:predicted RNase H-like HicB family nuclease